MWKQKQLCCLQERIYKQFFFNIKITEDSPNSACGWPTHTRLYVICSLVFLVVVVRDIWVSGFNSVVNYKLNLPSAIWPELKNNRTFVKVQPWGRTATSILTLFPSFVSPALLLNGFLALTGRKKQTLSCKESKVQAAAPCDFLNGTSLITFYIVIGWKKEAGTSCLSKARTPRMKIANVRISLSSPSEYSREC